MRKYIFKSCALLCVALSISACNNKFGDGVKLKGIDVGEPLSLNMGTSATVPAYPIPWDCTDFKFTYSSSNEEVASVSKFGKITANDPGDATITITCGSYSNSVNVNVYEVTIGDKCQELDGLTALYEFPASNPMKATVGKDLIAYHHGEEELGVTDGAENDYSVVTGFNKRDGAIKTVDFNPNFYCEHGLSDPAVYTLVIDAVRPASSDNKYTSFVNTDITNLGDQVIYLRKGGEVQFGGSGNRSTNAISNDKWYRYVFVKNGEEYMRTYVNTVLWNEGTALDKAVMHEKAVLFNADNDGDDRSLIWSTIAIFNRPLTETEILSLGAL